MSLNSGDCAKLPTPPPTLLRPRRRRQRRRRRWLPHNPTWQRGRTRPQDAGRGGARRKRAAAGPSPEEPPPLPAANHAAAGLAAPGRRPAPFRPSPGLRGRTRDRHPAHPPGPPAPFPAVLAPGGGGLQKSRAARPCAAVAHLSEASVQTQGPLPRMAVISRVRRPDVHTAGQKGLESGNGKLGRSDALPCAPLWFRSEPQVPGVSQTLSKLQQWKWRNKQASLVIVKELLLMDATKAKRTCKKDFCSSPGVLRRIHVFVIFKFRLFYLKYPEYISPPSCELESILFRLLIFFFLSNPKDLVFFLP